MVPFGEPFEGVGGAKTDPLATIPIDPETCIHVSGSPGDPKWLPRRPPLNMEVWLPPESHFGSSSFICVIYLENDYMTNTCFYFFFHLCVADKKEVDRLKRNIKVLIIVVIICLVLAIVATIVAVYAVSNDDSGEDKAHDNGQDNGNGAGCDGIECLHGGSCVKALSGGSYMCTCVLPFYGILCENGR